MEKEYNMTINRLPAKTWNWLRMNETQLEKIEVPTAGGVKVSLPEKITMERDTLSEYPVQILRSGMDLTSLLSADLPGQTAAPDLGEGMVPVRQLVTQMVSGITSNDLKSLKTYLESDACTIGYVNFYQQGRK